MTAETHAETVVARRVKDFCRVYGVGVTTTYKLLKEGRIRAVKVGRRTLILEDSAREWVESISVAIETEGPVHNVHFFPTHVCTTVSDANYDEQKRTSANGHSKRRYQRSSKFRNLSKGGE